MKPDARRLGLGLLVMALLALSVGIAAARDFGRPNPWSLAIGIHEIGLYTMSAPGTYGRLWPIKPIYRKDPLDGKGATTQAAGCGGLESALPTLDLGSGPSVATKVPNPIQTAKMGLARSEGSVDAPLAGYLEGGGSANRVQSLEDDLRGLIDRLHHN